MGRAMIMLVSAQPMPNLLSALDPALEVTKAHLIVSGDMEVGGQADALAKALEQRGITVQKHMLSNAFDLEEARRLVMPLLEQEPERFIVNLTGGTKVMSLGAYKAALDANVRDILYTDHENSDLHWLGGNRQPQKGCAEASIKEILTAHGVTIQKQQPAPSAADLKLAALLHERLDGDLLGVWNSLFKEVEYICYKNRKWRVEPVDVGVHLNKQNKPSSPEIIAALHSALCLAAEHGFCHFDGDQLMVDRRDQRNFLGGGWFEVVVWQALNDAKTQLNLAEVALNVSVKDKRDNGNEFDAIARTADNRLILIEVKTATMSGPYGKATDHFYKLDSQKPKAGLTAAACLVSRVEVKGKEVQQRFTENKIGLIDGEKASPKTLALALADWVARQRPHSKSAGQPEPAPG